VSVVDLLSLKLGISTDDIEGMDAEAIKKAFE
jgi:hypothetical protein